MRNTGLYISLIIFLLFWPLSPGSSQEIAISTSLSADTMLIGDQIYYSLRIKQPEGINIEFPVFGDTLVKNIEILENPGIDTSITEDGRLLLKKDLLITGFDSGSYRIPGQKFSIAGEGTTKEFISGEDMLQIMTMPLDTAQAIFDIKQPYGASLQFIELVPYILGLLILAIIIFVLVYYLKRRKQGAGITMPGKPLIPPHITALQELDVLKEERLWQNNREKEYYSRISSILRLYLEGRYRIFAMEQTSDEILDSLLKARFNDNRLFEKLKTILGISDLAKFAKFRPSPDMNESSLLDAYIFVNETKIEENEKDVQEGKVLADSQDEQKADAEGEKADDEAKSESRTEQKKSED